MLRAMRRSTSSPRKPGNYWPLFPEVIRRSRTANQIRLTGLATTSTFKDTGAARVWRNWLFPLEPTFTCVDHPPFLRDMNRDLISLGVPQNAIHQEVFGPGESIEPGVTKTELKPPHSPVPLGTGPIVSFTRSGLAVPWDTRFKSILELAEACDVPVRWSCRTGVCHTCECGILDGRLRYAPEPLDRPALGNALICCSTPESPIELEL